MKYGYIFFIILFFTLCPCLSNVQPVIPGESLYAIVGRIGVTIDLATSGVSVLESQLQGLTGLDSTASLIEVLGSEIDQFVTLVSNLSAQDALVYNIVSQESSSIDQIYNTTSAIDSKIDQLKLFPDFVQTPTLFTSQNINATTSRYFFTKRTLSGLDATEMVAFSFWNTSPNTVVRISGVGCGMDTNYVAGLAGNGISTFITLYKDSTLTNPNWQPFNANSILQTDTAATAFSGGIPVYELQAGTTTITAGSVPRAFEYLPKDVYSVVIAPGEMLTVGVGMATLNATDTTSIIFMWEEIIN